MRIAAPLAIASSLAFAACSDGGSMGAMDMSHADHVSAADLAHLPDLVQVTDLAGLPDLAKTDGGPGDGSVGDGLGGDGFAGDGFAGDGFGDDGFAGDGFAGDGGDNGDGGGGDGGGGFPPCPATFGFVGPNGACGTGGTCGNVTYEISCDGQVCTCTANMNVTQSLPEPNGACNMINNLYINACGY
jgi:hypothetical protein